MFVPGGRLRKKEGGKKKSAGGALARCIFFLRCPPQRTSWSMDSQSCGWRTGGADDTVGWWARRGAIEAADGRCRALDRTATATTSPKRLKASGGVVGCGCQTFFLRGVGDLRWQYVWYDLRSNLRS